MYNFNVLCRRWKSSSDTTSRRWNEMSWTKIMYVNLCVCACVATTNDGFIVALLSLSSHKFVYLESQPFNVNLWYHTTLFPFLKPSAVSLSIQSILVSDRLHLICWLWLRARFANSNLLNIQLQPRVCVCCAVQSFADLLPFINQLVHYKQCAKLSQSNRVKQVCPFN